MATLNFIEALRTSLQRTRTYFDNNVTTLTNNVDTLKSRVDVLEEESTISDVELQDIRVGVDGTVYDSAGEAVRGQVSKLSEDKVSLPKDINGNVLAPTEGQTILFNEDGTTYYGTPQSSGGSIGGNMTDDGDLVITYSSQSSGGGGDVTEPETPTITGIVATYGGGDVPEGTSLLNLKNVTVIVQYSDGSTGSATDGYTLSLPDGALALSVGVNTVTAEYRGFTATFEVTAYESDEPVESIYDSALYDVSIYSL